MNDIKYYLYNEINIKYYFRQKVYIYIMRTILEVCYERD